MKIIEQYICAKNGDPESCEDALVVTPDYAAAIDGMTSKSTILWDGKTSGKQAARTLLMSIQTLPPMASASFAGSRLNNSLVDYYHAHDMYDQAKKNPLDRLSASMIVYSNYQQELWLFGDCQGYYQDFWVTNPKLIDTVLSNLRAWYLEMELLRGKTVEELLTHDTGRQAITPFLKAQYRFQNANKYLPFAYSVLDGFFTDLSAIKVVKVPSGVTELVLATDGYPVLRPTLAESEACREEIQRQDPLCFRDYKSTKGLKSGNLSFDDRAYLRLKI